MRTYKIRTFYYDGLDYTVIGNEFTGDYYDASANSGNPPSFSVSPFL